MLGLGICRNNIVVQGFSFVGFNVPFFDHSLDQLNQHCSGFAIDVYHVAVFDTEWYVPGYAKIPIK